jgi:hypothetical protein
MSCRLTRRYDRCPVVIAVQIMVLWNDYASQFVGKMTSPTGTEQSLYLQVFLTASIVLLSMLSIFHLWADDREWNHSFVFINPSLVRRGKLPWRYWVKIFHGEPPGWGLVRDSGTQTIYFSDTVRGRIMQLQTAPTSKLSVVAKAKVLDLHYDPQQTLHGYIPITELEVASRKNVTWKKRLVPGPGAPHLAAEQFGYLEDRDNWYYFSRNRVAKVTKINQLTVWETAPRSHQVDGPPDDAGFFRIAARIVHNHTVYLTDGAWVRCINASGEVSTWGGKPLGEFKRSEPPQNLAR